MKYKAISIITIFIFSVLVWVFVSFSYEYSMHVSVPVVIKNLSKNSQVSLIKPSKINVLLKGKGWQLIQYSFGNVQNYVIDVQKSHNITKLVTKKYLSNNDWLTSNVEVISIDPEIIKIKVEKEYSKKVKIYPDINPIFKEGYGLVSEIICNPDSVLIFGPWSKTILIDQIKTEKTKLDNVESSQSLILKLLKPEYISLEKEETEVTFSVDRIVDKRFDNVEIQKINVPANHELILYPSRIAVVLKGGIQKLANLKSEDIHAVIDYNQAVADSVGALEPTINIEKYFKIIDIIPNKIKYIIKQL